MVKNLVRFLDGRQILKVQICAAFLILAGLIFVGTSQPVQDERFYLPTVKLLLEKKFGLTPEFLNFDSTYGVTPGPLYALTHALFSGLTQLDIKKMRILNVFFFFLTIAITSKTMSSKEGRDNFWKASTALFLPSLFAAEGLALTEGPALLFLAAGCFFLKKAVQFSEQKLKQIIRFIASGCLFGVAATGRQTFVMVLPATLAFLFDRRTRLIPFLWGSMLPLPFLLMLAWQGVMPKTADPGWLVWFEHPFYIPFGYAGLFMLILAPSFFVFKRKAVFWIMAASICIGFLPGFPKRVFMMSVTDKILGGTLVFDIAASVCSAILMGVGILFIVSLIRRGIENRQNNFYVFLTTFVFSLMLLHAALGVFTSRYVANIAFFIVLLAEDRIRWDFFSLWRYTIGLILGTAGLASCLF